MSTDISKQAAISSDDGVNQEAFGLRPLPESEDASIGTAIAEDANSGMSARFEAPAPTDYSVSGLIGRKEETPIGRRFTADQYMIGRHPSEYRTKTGETISTPRARQQAQALYG